MLFSVIIPTYNRLGLLQRTLASVWKQEFSDYEVIVVDDGSADGTLEWLREQGSRLVSVEQAHCGPGAARNRGAERARGDYLAFLDSDDIWFPWSLAMFAEAIDAHGRPGLVAASLVEFQNEVDLAKVSCECLNTLAFKDYYAAATAGNAFVGAGMMVVSRDVFQSAGGFAEWMSYAEDCELTLRLGLVEGFVQIRAPITLGYRRHPSSARSSTKIREGLQYLVDSERERRFPGGNERRLERLRLITLHCRPASVECLATGRWWSAWLLFGHTFWWHVVLGRWKYLFGFPFCFASYSLGIARRLQVRAVRTSAF